MKKVISDRKSRRLWIVLPAVVILVAVIAHLSVERYRQCNLSNLDRWRRGPTSSLASLKAEYEEVSIREWVPLEVHEDTGKIRPAVVFDRSTHRQVGENYSPTTEDVVKGDFLHKIAKQYHVKPSDLSVYAKNKVELDRLPETFTGSIHCYEKRNESVGEFFNGRKVYNITLFNGRITDDQVGHIDW